jgi:hypothetical protein
MNSRAFALTPSTVGAVFVRFTESHLVFISQCKHSHVLLKYLRVVGITSEAIRRKWVQITQLYKLLISKIHVNPLSYFDCNWQIGIRLCHRIIDTEVQNTKIHRKEILKWGYENKDIKKEQDHLQGQKNRS